MSYERKGPAAWAIHPGEVLKEEFLKPMKLSGYSLAEALNVTPQRLTDILLKKSGLSADMAGSCGEELEETNREDQAASGTCGMKAPQSNWLAVFCCASDL